MDEADSGRMAGDRFLQDALASLRQKQTSGPGLLFCDDCGDPIPAARRQACPGCTRCVACQAAFEKKGAV